MFNELNELALILKEVIFKNFLLVHFSASFVVCSRLHTIFVWLSPYCVECDVWALLCFFYLYLLLTILTFLFSQSGSVPCCMKSYLSHARQNLYYGKY